MDSYWHVTPLDVVDAEQCERLIARVQNLPAITRQVVVLRKVYGFTQEQIAAKLYLDAEEVLEHLTAAVRACADFGEIADA